MAVRVRLSSRGIPARAVAAGPTLAVTPERATGGWSHPVITVYGTDGVPTPGPSNVMAVPPGPTPGHTAAVPELYPTWSIVFPALPRLLPTCGSIPHGIPGVTYTAAVPATSPAASMRPVYRTRTGAGRGRVTTAPKPSFHCLRQGR
jgi:hypothetical protein